MFKIELIKLYQIPEPPPPKKSADFQCEACILSIVQAFTKLMLHNKAFQPFVYVIPNHTVHFIDIQCMISFLRKSLISIRISILYSIFLDQYIDEGYNTRTKELLTLWHIISIHNVYNKIFHYTFWMYNQLDEG